MIYTTLSDACTAWCNYRVVVVTLDKEVLNLYIINIWVKFYTPIRFIRFHALVHLLSPVNASSDGVHISLALVISALLTVGMRCRISSHIIYTLYLACLASSHLICFILQGVFQTCWILGEKLRTLL